MGTTSAISSLGVAPTERKSQWFLLQHWDHYKKRTNMPMNLNEAAVFCLHELNCFVYFTSSMTLNSFSNVGLTSSSADGGQGTLVPYRSQHIQLQCNLNTNAIITIANLVFSVASKTAASRSMPLCLAAANTGYYFCAFTRLHVPTSKDMQSQQSYICNKSWKQIG